jgi:hypothetical protein
MVFGVTMRSHGNVTETLGSMREILTYELVSMNTVNSLYIDKRCDYWPLDITSVFRPQASFTTDLRRVFHSEVTDPWMIRR